MPRCAICLRDNPAKFKTSRLTICTRCVNLLNKTELTPREADERLRQKLRADVVHKHGDNGGVDDWVSRKFPTILDEWCKDPECKGVPLKVIRAYRRQLVCLDRRYLDYPADWRMRSFRHKHRDDYTCNVCGKRDDTCRDLHAHHIIFRSRSGTNYAANIVVLCFEHHQAQHPDHVITAHGGEAAGFDQDTTSDPLDDIEESVSVPPAPPSLWIPDLPTMAPRAQPMEEAIPVQSNAPLKPPTASAGIAGSVLRPSASNAVPKPAATLVPNEQRVDQPRKEEPSPDSSWTADRLWTIFGVIFLLLVLGTWR